jgi:hypothetical protein
MKGNWIMATIIPTFDRDANGFRLTMTKVSTIDTFTYNGLMTAPILVSLTTLADVLSQKAYMLFYVKTSLAFDKREREQ